MIWVEEAKSKFETEHFCRVDNTLSELIVNKVVRQKLFVQEKSTTWIYSNGSESGQYLFWSWDRKSGFEVDDDLEG